MRISADKTDPDYAEDCWRYTVYLDGAPFKNYCVTVDEEKGEAVWYAEDENRALLRDAQGKQVYVTGKGKFTVVRSSD